MAPTRDRRDQARHCRHFSPHLLAVHSPPHLKDRGSPEASLAHLLAHREILWLYSLKRTPYKRPAKPFTPVRFRWAPLLRLDRDAARPGYRRRPLLSKTHDAATQAMKIVAPAAEKSRTSKTKRSPIGTAMRTIAGIALCR